MTLEQLLRILRYEPATGHFYWLIHTKGRGGAICPGDLAGHRSTPFRPIFIGYAGRIYRAHRLAWLYMTGTFPPSGMDVEHRDADPHNNRWGNLFVVPHIKNMQNLNDRLRKDNSSGCRGTSQRLRDGKWEAYITVEKRRISLGFYANLSDAVAARKAAELRYFDLDRQPLSATTPADLSKRIRAGIDRAKSRGKRLGPPPLSSVESDVGCALKSN